MYMDTMSSQLEGFESLRSQIFAGAFTHTCDMRGEKAGLTVV